MTWSRLGVERISTGGQWRHWVGGGWKIQNGKWHIGNTIFPMMMMTTAIAIRRAVDKTREPTRAKGKEPVQQDQRGEDDDNASEDDDPRAFEWFPMCSRKLLATELVSHLSGI
jgi:hypothetical protein